MITAEGCWADMRAGVDTTRGRHCLFLDRDGVLIEDTGYPHRPAEVTLIPAAVEAAAVAHRSGWVVGIVSNQSGVGRGLFGWDAFAAVQEVIDAAVWRAGGRIDFVLACPHHPDAPLARYRAAHPWRKPAPGMLEHAASGLALAIHGSIMVGDKPSDMAAAAAAGVPHRLLLAEGATTGASTSPDLCETVPRGRLVARLSALVARRGG